MAFSNIGRLHVTKIVKRYDPEFDTVREGPAVTWADRDLLDLILELEERVAILEERRGMSKPTTTKGE